MEILRATEFSLDGHGKVTLRKDDHLATGGEGSAYRHQGLVIKLYTDTDKMIRDGMPEKLKLLSAIRHDFIVAPRGLVTDSRGKPVGYFMPFVEGGEFLTRIFTSGWQQPNNWTVGDTQVLAEGMRDTVLFAHSHHAVMGDANELNWFMVRGNKKRPEPRAIDVDAWQIGRFPCQVIMPNIKDHHAKGFSNGTDYFAWGILAFQLFVGVHPYGGRLDGYKPAELMRRMADNASVFAPGVRLPAVARPLDGIPPKLLEWFEQTFQKGKREMPPSPLDTGTANAVATIARMVATQGGGMLVFDRLLDAGNDPAIRVFPCGVVLRKSGQLFDLATQQQIGIARSYNCEVVEAKEYWLVADWDGNTPLFAAISRDSRQAQTLNHSVSVEKLVRYENRLFAVTPQGLAEMELLSLGKTVLIGAGNTWGATKATQWFDGIGIMDAMGAQFAIVPFGANAVAQLRVRELDGLRPVAAKAGNRFAVIVGVNRKGEYRKVELTFDESYGSYKAWEGGAERPDLNMAMMPNGVVLQVVDDGELLAFIPSTGKLTRFADPKVNTALTFQHWGNKGVYIHKGNVWSVRTK